MATAPDASAATDPRLIGNRTFDEIAIGDSATLERTLGAEDLRIFAVLSGDSSPLQPAPGAGDSGAITQGMWGSALIAAVLGSDLPGPGTRLVSQDLRFDGTPAVGDELRVTLRVRERDAATRRLVLDCTCTNQHGGEVIAGTVAVVAPAVRMTRPRSMLAEVRIVPGNPGARRLLDHVQPLGAIHMAVVHPCNEASLSGAIEARRLGLVEPVLVGPRAKIEAAAAAAGFDLAGMRIEDATHSHAAAARAAELAVAGEVEALMKGSLHTDELMAALLPSSAGLRTKRRVSHCYLMQTPTYPRPFLITDAAINIAPTLDDKADIIRNAIDLARMIGVEMPRVAILAAVETVNPRMPATLDAAALCKMADRGQIAGGLLDGPLAFDNAVSIAAARIKGIDSEVAGMADILVVPDLESGNMLAKQLEFLGDAESAGIVLGLRVPVVLTSRADPLDSRISSCALAVLIAHHHRTCPP